MRSAFDAKGLSREARPVLRPDKCREYKPCRSRLRSVTFCHGNRPVVLSVQRTSRGVHVAAQSQTVAQRNNLLDKALAASVSKLPYTGVVFDMDGTLTESRVDYADMRARIGIPVGDIFAVMEHWDNPQDIKRAMGIISEMEAEAAASTQVREGAPELLHFLRDAGCRVALVTRNTRASVQAFLDRLGPDLASVFDPILTRESAFVMPDKRVMNHVAQAWSLEPWSLLVVSSSAQDIEVGNAAGAASCLVEGSGGSGSGSGSSPNNDGTDHHLGCAPALGAVPTLTVPGLHQLRSRLEAAAGVVPAAGTSVMPCPEAAGPKGAVSLGWPAREGVGLPVVRAGAPPPGLSFLQWAVDVGGLRPAPVSLPRMAAATRGLPLLPNYPVSKVLHVGCGDGGLTRMIASQGLQVLGTDADVSAATKRGLVTVPLAPRPAGSPPTAPCIKATLAQVSGWEEGARFDCIVVQQGGSGAGVGGDVSSSVAWLAPGAMQEVRDLLAPDGRLCAELALLPSPRVHPAAIINAVNASGMTVVAWQVVRASAVSQGQAATAGSCAAGASGGNGVGPTPEFMRLVARPTC